MRFSYHTQQLLPYPLERVFDFFANPENLPLLMPSWQKARIDSASILAPPPPPRPPSDAALNSKTAGAGSKLSLSFRPLPLLPFRLSWDAEISEFRWDQHFCDRQLRGPFAYWRHCHNVRRVNQSGVDSTHVADDLEYEIPFGLAGSLAHRLFLRRQIEQVFAFRKAQLARIFSSATERLP
jgi:ligand-binding SRPBCC domain-containing protein